ncbi:hypothetical protein [Exiguobacterium marinum]|uniref:hypothetical protein n=1 Tax=Exiguobacterium marinum TaxID=273528 RepID=UPI000683F0B8|nr:hypothetical protein [Exiguobacterium marinum]
MHPIELIEHVAFFILLAIPLLLALALRGKWRLGMVGVALLIVMTYGTFYFSRPVLIAERVAEDKHLVDMYLAEQYPDETYSIRTIPFRADGFEHTNPYTIYVTFTNEPNAEYYYRVDEKNDVSISGFTGNVQDFRFK